MKLTATLKTVILKQFKQGDDMEYLDKLYQLKPGRTEQVVREAMIEIDEKNKGSVTSIIEGKVYG